MKLSDEDLEMRLASFVGNERGVLADFLEHLIEFDGRRLGQKRAYGSTFDYCHRKLRLSEDESYKRINAARAARRDRRILGLIRDGKLSLTSVVRLSSHAAKDSALWDWAIGKSTREIEQKIAALTGSEARYREIVEYVGTPSGQWEVRLRFNVRPAVYEMFEKARDLSRHRRPEGRLEQIFEDGLEALLDAIDRSRKEKPAPKRELLPGRRDIAEWIKDIVWKRDGGRCAYQADGRRCESTAWLEYDHIERFSEGGRSDDPANIRLLCRAHNQLIM